MEIDDQEELRGEINIKSPEEYRSIVQVPILESEMKEINSQKNDIVAWDIRSICRYTKGISVEECENNMKQNIPAKRFAEPEEVAAAVAFLSSPSAGFINGINLPLDGGNTPSL